MAFRHTKESFQSDDSTPGSGTAAGSATDQSVVQEAGRLRHVVRGPRTGALVRTFRCSESCAFCAGHPTRTRRDGSRVENGTESRTFESVVPAAARPSH